MKLPFDPILFGYEINLHLVLEYLAFFLGYRYYVEYVIPQLPLYRETHQYQFLI